MWIPSPSCRVAQVWFGLGQNEAHTRDVANKYGYLWLYICRATLAFFSCSSWRLLCFVSACFMVFHIYRVATSSYLKYCSVAIVTLFWDTFLRLSGDDDCGNSFVISLAHHLRNSICDVPGDK